MVRIKFQDYLAIKPTLILIKIATANWNSSRCYDSNSLTLQTHFMS